MAPSTGLDFLVNKNEWQTHRVDESPAPTIEAGEVLFRIDRFALTANNITYAVAGESLGYWRFFLAPEGWGRLPTMGFADVIESKHPEVAVGTRCFGFYPMSRYLKIEPSSVTASGITDGAKHREGIAPTYAQYTPTTGDALYRPEHEDALMLMRGLFMTSFLADDFLVDQRFGEEAVLISSASSKTGIALGHLVASSGRARSVGLTSSGNLEFVQKLGCYDEVFTYDDVARIDASRPTVYVDMAGNTELRRRIHTHFGSQLKHSCTIGATHWEAREESDNADLPGPTPELFFAPSQVQKRAADWGPAELQNRLAAGWAKFQAFSESWLQVERGQGPEAIARAYEKTLAGQIPPQNGQVLSMWQDGE